MLKYEKYLKFTVLPLIALLIAIFALSAVACGSVAPSPAEPDNGPVTVVPGEETDDGNEQDAPGDSDGDDNGNSSDKEEEPAKPAEPPAWQTNYTLPDAAQVKERLSEIYGSEDKIFLLQSGRILRMPCPRDGAKMALNFIFEVPSYSKGIFENCVEEFNEVFAVINPNYVFEINYSPTAEDLKSEYSIRISSVESFARPETLGTAAHSYVGDSICNFSIQLRKEVPHDGSKILSVFKHELMHLLGAGDAYDNANATTDTIMQGYSLGGLFSFSNSDVAFLDAMYRNPENALSDEEIEAFTESYSEQNVHTYAVNEARVYKNLLEDLDEQALANHIRALGYEQTACDKAITALSNGWRLDGDFGTYSVSFSELPFEEPAEKTYAGSFDVDDRKYWHTENTNGLGNTMGIKYADYGSGILSAAPGGTANITFFVSFGDYVFAFHREESFRRLDLLEITLIRVYIKK